MEEEPREGTLLPTTTMHAPWNLITAKEAKARKLYQFTEALDLTIKVNQNFADNAINLITRHGDSYAVVGEEMRSASLWRSGKRNTQPGRPNLDTFWNR